MSSTSRNRQTNGFTLIEVLITMAILAFVSMGIFQATTNSFRLREELTVEGEFFTAIRLSMNLLNHDITMIYSPTLLIPPKVAGQPQPGQSPNPAIPPKGGPGGSNIDETGIPAATAADLALPFEFWSAATDKSGLRPSRFNGKDKSMTFVSASNYRIYRDAPESEFAKITYEFDPDTGTPINGFKVPDSFILVKKISPDVFDTDDFRADRSFTHSYTLLRGITKYTLTYYKWDEEKFKPFKEWDSDTDDFKYQIPDIVEISFKISGATGLSFEGLYQFRPELPFHGLNPSF